MDDRMASVSSEVRELLREAAASPGSVLYSAPARETMRHPLGATGEGPVPWSRVEKHIVLCHQAEFAFLLRSQWLVALADAGGDSSKLLVRRGVDEPVIVPDRRELEASWLEWQHDSTGVGESERPKVGADALRLARLSLDLDPSAARWVDLALSFLVEGDRRQALAFLHRAATMDPGHRMASCILTNRGLVHSMQGQDARALGCYREASRLWPEHLSAVASWLVLALTVGHAVDAGEAAVRLNELVSERHEGTEEQVDACRRWIREGTLVPTTASRILASRIADAHAGAAGRIADVLS